MSEICSSEDVEDGVELLMDEGVDEELMSPQEVSTIKAIDVKR